MEVRVVFANFEFVALLMRRFAFDVDSSFVFVHLELLFSAISEKVRLLGIYVNFKLFMLKLC